MTKNRSLDELSTREMLFSAKGFLSSSLFLVLTFSTKLSVINIFSFGNVNAILAHWINVHRAFIRRFSANGVAVTKIFPPPT